MRRIQELDGLRALAVLAVVAFHYTLGTALANRVTALGWMGVDLFFVLSGYLITGILLSSRGQAGYFSTFYARRTLRIFPVYFLLLAVYFAAARWGGGPQPAGYWTMHAAFLSSTVERFHSWSFAAPAFVYAGVTVLWSLSIEEQFYLLWAPVVRWLRPSGLWWFLAAILAAAPLLRHHMHTAVYPEYRFLPARFDSLAWGALLALAFRQWGAEARALRRGLAVAGAGAAVAVASLLWSTGGRRESLAFATYGYSALAVLFAAVLGATVLAAGGSSWPCRALRWSPAQYLGRVSYTVYLVHYPLLLLAGAGLARWLGPSAGGILCRDGVALLAAVVLAGASWRWLETPMMRFKDRWAPARGGPRPSIEPRPVGLRTVEVMASQETV